uniref:Uncharacterized protein n=1 Tax=Solanum tuberosum TaxID=4113 RepID=M0ZHS3_SOLTU
MHVFCKYVTAVANLRNQHAQQAGYFISSSHTVSITFMTIPIPFPRKRYMSAFPIELDIQEKYIIG